MTRWTPWTAERLAALHEAFRDPAVSREMCAERFNIGRIRLYQIAHAQGWLPAEKRPSRGPIKYHRAVEPFRHERIMLRRGKGWPALPPSAPRSSHPG